MDRRNLFHWGRLFFATTLMFAFTTRAAQAQTVKPQPLSYDFAQLDYPGAVETELTGINNAGEVVGTYQINNVRHAFRWKQGVFQNIDFPGAAYTRADGINNQGDIVGSYQMDSPFFGFHPTGFLLTANGFTTIAAPGAQSTEAFDITGRVIVGDYYDQNFRRHGFRLTGGVFETIDMPGAFNTAARGINARGTIVGDADNHGFVLRDGEFTAIPLPGAGESDAAWDINGRGWIVGGGSGAFGTHGYVLNSNGFTLIDFPGLRSSLTGVNGLGNVTGSFFDNNARLHGFIGVRR